MKKLIAIFFLLLISCVTVGADIASYNTGYEQCIEGEDKLKEKGENKKEYTSNTYHKFSIVRIAACIGNTIPLLWLPHPTVDQPTPPPNTGC